MQKKIHYYFQEHNKVKLKGITNYNDDKPVTKGTLPANYNGSTKNKHR